MPRNQSNSLPGHVIKQQVATHETMAQQTCEKVYVPVSTLIEHCRCQYDFALQDRVSMRSW
eukprot:1791845-Karenia_brevis.AAC.1